MQIASSTIKYSAVTLLCGFFLASVLPSHSQPAAQGVALYKKGKFAEAVKVFDGVCQSPTTDPNTLYYYALSLHQMGNFDKARRAYQRVAQQYPSSPAGRMAVQALSAFGTPGRSTSGGSGSTGGGTAYAGGAGDGENLPETARIYYKPSSSTQMIVDAYVNNRPIKMLFDTGADGCAFGKNHLREMGINIPTGKPSYQSQGVGDQGAIDTWDMRAVVRVGTIERNVEIGVQEKMDGEPLLGQNFFNAFTYTIDKGSNSITFTRKRRGQSVARGGGYGGGADRNAVPFEKMGNSMVVMGQVNGKPCKFIFDTGADGTVFAHGDLKRLGIQIPDDAQEERHGGIAGDTRGLGFEMARITLGPIDRTNYHVAAIEGMAEGHPLLGRTFFGDWQYTIDNDAKLIHFLRR